MRRVVIRLVMAVIGVVSFAVYAAGAYLVYRLLALAWADRPSAMTVIAVFVVVTLFLGYVGYRYGTRGLLASMPSVEPPAGRRRRFEERLEDLCERMAIETPTVRFTDLDEPNAFAMSGPSGGAVVFDLRLFELLDDDELEAILAHELAHLEARDGLIQSLAFTGLQTVMSVVSILLLPVLLFLTGLAKASAWLRGRPGTWSKSLAWRFRSVVVALVMVVPIVITFVLLVRSRRQEYAADRRAAEVTGKPLALASALQAVNEAMIESLRLQGLLPEGETPPDPVYRLLSTHPAIEKRVERLEAMASASAGRLDDE